MAKTGTFSDDGRDPLLLAFLPAPPVHLSLLNAFSVQVGAQSIVLPPGCERLLALLALHGRRTRSSAAGCLWPDAAQEKALACLRTCIWRCNQAADLVSAGLRTVELAPAVHVDIGDPRTADGELLPGWDDEWLMAERERLREVHLQHLDTQIDQLVKERQFGQALELARRSLAIEPLREVTHRAVIGIHVAASDHAAAVRAYQRCRTLLLTELGVEPSRQTVRLLDGVRSTPAESTASGTVGL
ncbi:MAG: bacterial transcriptional activator domain-containing protein [Candidatus Nanopelagicales bacterium]